MRIIDNECEPNANDSDNIQFIFSSKVPIYKTARYIINALQ